MKKLNNLALLESSGCLRILLVLYNRELSITEILKYTGITQHTIYTAINRLRKLGLIEERREHIFPRRRIIKLTEKGYLIAHYVSRINTVLES